MNLLIWAKRSTFYSKTIIIPYDKRISLLIFFNYLQIPHTFTECGLVFDKNFKNLMVFVKKLYYIEFGIFCLLLCFKVRNLN